MPSILVDEIGNKYGLLTVKKLSKDKNNKSVWLCECDCGNTKLVRGSDLRSKKITTCGAKCGLKYTRNPNFKDLTGQKFGQLLVISFAKINQNHKSVWHCLCDCGQQCDVLGVHLINGSTQSCGCLHRKLLQAKLSKDFIGKVFGYLTILEKSYDENQHIIWKCQCKCGNIVYLPAAYFSGEKGTRSCGCLKSKYELEIQQILEELKISFKKQQTFWGLKNIRLLRYDFSILLNNQVIGLIEYQGEQHFKPVQYWGGEEKFTQQQQHDKMKYDFAIMNNIPILYLTKEDNEYLKQRIINFLYKINCYIQKEDD